LALATGTADHIVQPTPTSGKQLSNWWALFLPTLQQHPRRGAKMNEPTKIVNVHYHEGPPPRKVGPFFFIGVGLFILALAGSCHLIMAIGEALR